MKKLSIFLAGMVALLGFSSCEADKDPVYKAPTQFTMNQSPLENQYLNLTEDGTFQLVASGQPDYGFSGLTTYSVIASLTPDFVKTTEIASMGSGTQSVMTFKAADLALAICELKGIETEEDYVDEPAIPVYFKGVAELVGVPESRIVSSNYVVLKQVKYYYAVPQPGYIYLIGTPNGWPTPEEGNAANLKEWRLFENENNIGSKIYTGVFNIPASPTFRFYTELTGWDGGASIGIQEPDNAMDVEMSADDTYDSPLVKGKGSFHITNWEGGEMTITVNLNDMTVVMIAGAHEVVDPQYIYVVGNNSGWAEPSADNAENYAGWRLVDKSDSGIYEGKFEITSANVDGSTGNMFCRFFKSLDGWNSAQLGSDTKGDVNVDVVSGTTYPVYAGEGCFVVPSPAGHDLSITLNLNDHTVTFVIE